MTLTLEQYVERLDSRKDLPWPVAPKIDPPKAKPSLHAMPVKVVFWTVYGTLVAIPQGELLFEHPQAFVTDAALPWPSLAVDAVLCINMIHISPWPATVGLVRGAAHLLSEGGILTLYGPYRRNGQHTEPSNAQFDAQLRATDPTWGVRDLEEVVALAMSQGFAAPVIEDMPANNLSVIFRRGS